MPPFPGHSNLLPWHRHPVLMLTGTNSRLAELPGCCAGPSLQNTAAVGPGSQQPASKLSSPWISGIWPAILRQCLLASLWLQPPWQHLPQLSAAIFTLVTEVCSGTGCSGLSVTGLVRNGSSEQRPPLCLHKHHEDFEARRFSVPAERAVIWGLNPHVSFGDRGKKPLFKIPRYRF